MIPAALSYNEAEWSVQFEQNFFTKDLGNFYWTLLNWIQQRAWIVVRVLEILRETAKRITEKEKSEGEHANP